MYKILPRPPHVAGELRIGTLTTKWRIAYERRILSVESSKQDLDSAFGEEPGNFIFGERTRFLVDI